MITTNYVLVPCRYGNYRLCVYLEQSIYPLLIVLKYVSKQ